MAKICEVCGKSTTFIDEMNIDGIVMHNYCVNTFEKEPDKYVKKPIETTKKRQQTDKEYQQLDKEINDKSVYVKGFSMPFGEMVEFMVKWAIASIPAFIILFIIFGILFAVFGALFF
ncbi:MAG: hypothetical protein HOF02_04765 [Gammaproteobacteria bacterium]|jgi:hypothetical protein|nr:hypothetical protein [Gammaproteobacteria bacterium]